MTATQYRKQCLYLAQIQVLSFFKDIHVNIVPTKCFIDFGSEVSLIKQSQASRLGLFYSDRPTALKGFGNEIVRTLGSVSVDVSVDGVVANVICQVVDDHYFELPILIGQSFTEQSHVAVYKTEDKLSFFHTCSEMPFSGVHIQNIAPVKLVAVSDVNVYGLASIKVTVDSLTECEIYTHMSLKLWL